MILELSVLMKSQHKESVRLLATAFVGGGNSLLGLEEFEDLFKDLMVTKEEVPSLMGVQTEQLLKSFFLEVFFPLLLKYPSMVSLLPSICQTLSERIAASKFKFDQLLNCLDCDFQFPSNDSKELFTQALLMLLNYISKQGS